jgi:hypothetical protein
VSNYYFLLPVFGGLCSGLLISVRWRKSGAYCLAISTIIGHGTFGSAINQSGHRQFSAAFTTFGAVLPCLVTLLLLSAKWVIWRVFGAVGWFGKALTSDMLTGIHRLRRLQKRKNTSGTSACPQDTVKLPWRWIVRFILMTVLLLTGRNAKSILDFLHDSAPRMSVVTNTLDLVSLILLTPKLFSGEARDNLHHLFLEIARGVFGKGVVAWDTKRRMVAGAIVYIIIFPVLYILLLINSSLEPRLIKTIDALSSAFHSEGIDNNLIDWLAAGVSGWLLLLDKFNKLVSMSALVSAVMASCIVVGARVRKLSPQQQRLWEDILFVVGVVLFVYSRELSML